MFGTMADETYTIDEYLGQARARLERVQPADLPAEIAAGALLVDVRDSSQRERDGEVPGAIPIDLTVLEWRLAPSSLWKSMDLDPDQRVILICKDGYSSSLAAARLQDLGLRRAADVDGGFTAWKAYSDSLD